MSRVPEQHDMRAGNRRRNHVQRDRHIVRDNLALRLGPDRAEASGAVFHHHLQEFQRYSSLFNAAINIRPRFGFAPRSSRHLTASRAP